MATDRYAQATPAVDQPVIISGGLIGAERGWAQVLAHLGGFTFTI